MNNLDPKEESTTHSQATGAVDLNLKRKYVAADDMTQDTISKAWSNMDNYQDGINIRLWHFTTLRDNFDTSRHELPCEVADIATYSKKS